MKKLITAVLTAFGTLTLASGEQNLWNGHTRLDFKFDGRPCILIVPEKPAPGKPWIWRTEFFDAFPSVDVALVKRGFHVAYMDMQDMFGAPAALAHMDKFYIELTEKRGLSPKTVLEGFSRGGLFALNWAEANAEKVSSIYVDAPVCDFRSWPGGMGSSPRSASEWEACKNAYGLTEDEALCYRGNPVNHLESLAQARVPIIAVCGEADTVVPIKENILVVEKRYRELGGSIKLILKPGVGHHPHSLEDPTPVVDFIMANQQLPD